MFRNSIGTRPLALAPFMASRPDPILRTACLALVAAAAVVFGGCASSARDEYNYVRELKVAPSAPTEISALDSAMPVVAQSDFRPRRWAEATRPGSISDADFEPR